MKTTKLVFRWWDSFTAVFMIIILLTSATRLYATNWTTYLERVQYLALLGAIAGLALGQSRFSTRIVRWISLAYTLFAVPWQLGSTMTSDMDWGERLYVLITRLGVATREVLQKTQVHDPILFLTLMAVLFWLIGLTAGYMLTRHGNPWPVILPAGIALMVIDHYDPGLQSGLRYVGIYLFFSLLILGRLTYQRYQAEWRSAGVVQSPGTGSDISRAALMAVVVLVVFAWTAPALGASLPQASQIWNQISKPLDTMRSNFSNAFSSLHSDVGAVTDFFSNSMALGTGTHLGNDLVFTVKASSPPPTGSRYYWRARSYDSYQDGNWSTTVSTQQPINPATFSLSYPNWRGRVQVGFTFTSNVSMLSTIYSPSLPVSVSRAGSVTLILAPDGTMDSTVLIANPALRAGETYQVKASISDPTATMLRDSGTNYPQWVKDRYLQLPDNLPADVKDLAKQVTYGLNNPYDDAETITRYLRNAITYSETVPPTPAGKEPIEFFLFTSKTGYCNYYATAEVLMLRAIGIPARLSVGFAEGTPAVDELNPSPNAPVTYTVRYKDSHAWPEVYFNGVGWVEFEPTVSQPNRVLPQGSGAGSTDPNNDIQRGFNKTVNGVDGPAQQFLNTVTTGGGPVGNAARVMFIILILPCVGVLGWSLYRRRAMVEVPLFPVWLEKTLSRRGLRVPGWLKRWSRWALFSPLEHAYNVVNHALRLLGRAPVPSETPAERVMKLSTILPPATAPAETLLAEYEHAMYSLHPGDVAGARDASHRVRSQAWKAWLVHWWNRFNRE